MSDRHLKLAADATNSAVPPLPGTAEPIHAPGARRFADSLRDLAKSISLGVAIHEADQNDGLTGLADWPVAP
ncbi:MAG TPA: hypothetical protein VFY10_11525 [Dehalococcoidia bacterium]|nr:hypothetical protein [Dehalococcoidia bacterium]